MTNQSIKLNKAKLNLAHNFSKDINSLCRIVYATQAVGTSQRARCYISMEGPTPTNAFNSYLDKIKNIVWN